MRGTNRNGFPKRMGNLSRGKRGRGPSTPDALLPRADDLSTTDNPTGMLTYNSRPAEAAGLGSSMTSAFSVLSSSGNAASIQCTQGAAVMPQAETDGLVTTRMQGNETLLQSFANPRALQGMLGGGQLTQAPGFMSGGATNPALHLTPSHLQLFAQSSLNQMVPSLPLPVNVFPPKQRIDHVSAQMVQSSLPATAVSAGSTGDPQNLREGVAIVPPAPSTNDSFLVGTSTRRQDSPPLARPIKRAKTAASESKPRKGQAAHPNKARGSSNKGVDAVSGRIADRRYNNPTSSSMSLVASARAEDRLDQRLTGIPPISMYLSCDEESLSDYQCFLRQQIDLFEATNEDIQLNAQKMNKSVVLGQVGLRCRHCAKRPPWTRSRGAVYYSATLDGLYQAGQNMSKNHFSNHCASIPEQLKSELINLKDCKRRAGGGKQYWSEAARALGVYEDQYGLRFRDPSTRRSKK